MDDKNVASWLKRDVIEEIDIIPAKFIYSTDFNTSVWHIRECFWIWREVMYREGGTKEQSLQAWQYVKAYAKILKDKGHWNHQSGTPLDKEWKTLTPNTPRWIAYYMRHPDEQAEMHEFRLWWERKTGRSYNDA
ncbi:MAG: hypothetical protein ACXABY_06095 [Candidatus Thorarchaeota archaeon]|jgi:hypothetical protein